MSPTPIVPTGKHAYHPDCECKQCTTTYAERVRARNAHRYGAPDDPLSPARGILIGLGLSLCILVALAGAALIWAKTVQAREGAVHPIAAPEALLRARQACPNGSTLVECRGELRKAYAAVEWQKDEREHTRAMTVQAITRDAIAWAAQRYHVSAIDMIRVGVCESHLYPFATNGQYLGVWQLGATHRSDPIFQQVPWQDAYGQASHVARFVKAHSWGQWQCRPEGGLRW